MKNSIDDLLKAALTPNVMPKESINNQILLQINEGSKQLNKKRRHKKFSVAVIVACAAMMISATALAAYHYLPPAEVASELKDNSLKDAFAGKDAIYVNETQTCGEYKITLFGSVAGKELSQYEFSDEVQIHQDRIYTVVTIEKADGTPMPDTSSDNYGETSFLVSHYIQGLDPKVYNIITMNGNYSGIVRDGINYRLIEMDNIEMFADHEIYVGVSTGTFYNQNAYIYNENTGKIKRNENYNGVNALFVLPIDESKADKEAASSYLMSFADSNEQTEDEAEETTEIGDFVNKLNNENINQYASPIESTRQKCTPDADGIISYSYQLENGAGCDGAASLVSDIFPDGEIGVKKIVGYTYSNGLEDLLIDVLELNEDGTVTYVLYQPIIN